MKVSFIKKSKYPELKSVIPRHLRLLILVAFLQFSQIISVGAPPDPYGGYTKVKKSATGFFRLEKINNADYLITPTGHPFLALSVAHCSACTSETFEEPFKKEYGSDPVKLSQAIVTNLLKWNFNAAGYGVVPEMEQMIPFFSIFSQIRGPRALYASGDSHQVEYYDIFNEVVVEKNDAIIKELCKSTIKNPFCIGYYYQDIPLWNVQQARKKDKKDYPFFIKNLPSDAPGKKVYVEFIRKKYSDNIQTLNTTYSKSFASFEALLSWVPAELSKEGTAEFQDDREFQWILAEQYYSSLYRSVKKYDTNHLILGDRYDGRFMPDDEIIKVASQYCDVISFESSFFDRIFPTDFYSNLHTCSGLPLLIADHDFQPSALQSEDTLTERANLYENYLNAAFETGYIIGYTKCSYTDKAPPFFPNGLVTNQNEPKTKYIEIVEKANEKILRTNYEKIDIPSDEHTLTKEPPQDQRFKIYLNPASDTLYIQSSDRTMNWEVQVFDPTGKLVIQEQNKTTINTQSLKKGMYTVVVKSGSYEFAKKIMKI